MAINIGNSSINSIYIGDTAVKSVYLGDNLVYSKQTEPEIGIDNTYNTFVFDTSKSSVNIVMLQNYRAGDETEWDGLTDWGDGTINTELTHQYSKEGIYTVKTKYMLVDTTGASITYEGNTTDMLIECININKNVTDYDLLFYNCINLSNVHTSNFYTSNVTTMRRTFFGCEKLKSLDLSGWDVSNVTNMYETFRACTLLESLNLTGWNTSNVTTMYGMFMYCASLEIINVSFFNISKVKRMDYMFAYCNTLWYLNLSSLNVGYISINNIFRGCDSLSINNIRMDNCDNVTRTRIQEALNNK